MATTKARATTKDDFYKAIEAAGHVLIVANEPPTIPNGHVHDVVNAPGIVNLNGPGWVPTVAPGPHDGSHWTVSAADLQGRGGW